MLSFGTDGVRGVANSELTPEVALALGRAAARVLSRPGAPFYVGRDTRRSGPLLSAALGAGLASEGVDVVDVGVLPTPGVAWLAAADGAAAAMVSASHNPFADNGIKLFAAGGRKLTDHMESAVEAEARQPSGRPAAIGADVGTLTAGAVGTTGRYADFLVSTLEGRDLAGLRVVVDCGHGAAYEVAPAVLGRLGADVTVLNASPDGRNINDGCGSTHMEGLRAAVVAAGADCGVAFDGDADRCLAVDADGATVDGDQILAVLALDLSARGRLAGDALVVTVMSNLGLHLAMRRHGIRVQTTPVGDRHVLERMEQGGVSLGGEQSGHVILRDRATTGDGVLTALAVLDVVRRTGTPLAQLAGVVERLPQVLLNVPVTGDARAALDGAEPVWDVVRAVEADLGERGRVLLRPSGTEPLVRVMVEAPTEVGARHAAERIAAAVRDHLG